MDLDFNSRSQKCEKAKVSVAIFSQSFQLFKMECGILSRRVSMVNLIFSLFHPFSIQGKEPCLCDYEKKIDIGLYSDLKTDFFQTCMMMESTEL